MSRTQISSRRMQQLLVPGDASALFSESLVGDGSVENANAGSYMRHSTRRGQVHMDWRKRKGIRGRTYTATRLSSRPHVAPLFSPKLAMFVELVFASASRPPSLGSLFLPISSSPAAHPLLAPHQSPSRLWLALYFPLRPPSPHIPPRAL
ncbi:hypothetical protein GY45DRAFT_511334 [Cubamyces sp. BRFM 1775]|nr:hypothetical protein GY45DRAFT_511334 [Cubamyces sp. BRFM 1775]